MTKIARITPTIVQLTSLPFGPGSKYPYNSYLIGRERERILIDGGTGHPESISLLKQYTMEQNINIQHLLLTSESPGVKSIKNAFNLKIHNLKHGESIKEGGVDIKCLASPGYLDSHRSYALSIEDALFTGASGISRPDGHFSCNFIFGDLSLFRKTVEQTINLFPKLCFPAYGLMTVGVHQFETISNQLRMNEELIMNILHSKKPTKQIVSEFLDYFGINNHDDELIVQGAVRLHLLDLERKNLIERSDSIVQDHSNLDSKLKGPGGLTMEQIFEQIQKSRVRDFTKGKENLDIILHRLHKNAVVNSHTCWRRKPK